MTRTFYLSLGSNQGHRFTHLRKAINHLLDLGLPIVKCSPVFETQALLPEGAPLSWDHPYFNMVLETQTTLSPRALLQHIKTIERQGGREDKHARWSPRTIDIDILFSPHTTHRDEHLTIPHPELIHRPFLLALLAFIAPYATPLDDKTQTIGRLLMRSQPLQATPIQGLVLDPAFVGIVNLTTDSFSRDGLGEDIEKALKQCESFVKAGASAIDCGAQSSRPGAHTLTPQDELFRLEPFFKAFYAHPLLKNIPLSIDTFFPQVVKQLLNHKTSASTLFFNNVKGLYNDTTLNALSDKGAGLITMHSLSIPPSAQNTLPAASPSLNALHSWAHSTLKHLKRINFNIANVILDPGIGFGKKPWHNFEILNNLNAMHTWKVPIWLGLSRKSFMQTFSAQDAAERDIETLALSLSIPQSTWRNCSLRVHNVGAHQRAFVAQHILKSMKDTESQQEA